MGNEFRVNSFTTEQPALSLGRIGRERELRRRLAGRRVPGRDDGVFGQRYDSEGVAHGAEFRVNSFTTAAQAVPSVASDASGNFVVVWDSYGQDGSSDGIFGQRYDSAGVARGSRVPRQLLHDAAPGYPSVASDATATSSSSGAAHSRTEAATGSSASATTARAWLRGTSSRSTPITTGNQRLPSVAATGTNQFVVAWESIGQDGSGYGVFGQRFDFCRRHDAAQRDGRRAQRRREGVRGLVVPDPVDGLGRHRRSSSFDVSVSVDGGESFTPIAECQNVPDSATSCLWLAPGPPSVNALVRVAAEDTSGNSASDDSDAIFRIVSGTATLTVVSPNTNVKWRIGSLQTIEWTHNLGLSATFRIELDRDDDGNYEELIAAAAPADSATKGSFAWTVTGPPSGTARVRVSWTDDPAVSDASDVTFQIRPSG